MNRSKRVAVMGLLALGTSGISFGEAYTFQPLQSADWDATYNADTALFGAVVQQNGASLESGLPGTGIPGGAFTSNVEEAFTLTYDPSSGLADLIVGSDPNNLLDSITGVETLKVAAAGGTLDHVGIALSAGASDEAIAISDIVLNGIPDTDNVLSSNGEGLFDFAMTPAADLTGNPLILSGNIDMTWTGSAPASELSAEIVGADTGIFTPEPGTWALLLGSTLAGLVLRRGKQVVLP